MITTMDEPMARASLHFAFLGFARFAVRVGKVCEAATTGYISLAKPSYLLP
jgi:hypothetical protein